MYDQGQPRNPYEFGAEQVQNESNPLAIVGFILAFCVSPIGLIVSLIALAKRPRGFAIGGVVVGLLGSLLWVLGGMAGWAVVKYGLPALQTTIDVETIRTSLVAYQQNNNGDAPPDLATAGISGDTLTDAWGVPYQYMRGDDGKSWTLTLLGSDKALGTADDRIITSDMSDRDVQNVLKPMFEEMVREQVEGTGTGGKASSTSSVDPPKDEKPAEAPAPAPAPAP